jgi:hypothetical protein
MDARQARYSHTCLTGARTAHKTKSFSFQLHSQLSSCADEGFCLRALCTVGLHALPPDGMAWLGLIGMA